MKNSEKSNMKNKSNIGGKEITREEALEGLGDPSTWKKESEELYKKFREKPTVKTRFDSVREMLVEMKVPKKVLTKFDRLVAEDLKEESKKHLPSKNKSGNLTTLEKDDNGKVVIKKNGKIVASGERAVALWSSFKVKRKNQKRFDKNRF